MPGRASLLSLVAIIVVIAAALAGSPAALAADAACPNTPVNERVEAAEGAFVGHLLSERADPDVPGGYRYRFDVLESLKGPETDGTVVELRSAERLRSATGVPIVRFGEDDIGVIVRTLGGIPETSSCDLAAPVHLISAFDRPRGNAIKVVIGMILLLGVLGYAMVRLRRKQLRQQAAAEAAGRPQGR